MADVPTNFRTFLLAQTAIANIVGSSVHQAKVPADRKPPYVWFGRIGSAPVDLLNPDVGLDPGVQLFAVECIALDLNQAQDLGDALRAKNNYRGSFGDSSVQGLFIEEQTDDYEYRTIDGDEGFHTCAFTAEIHPN